MTIKFDLKGRHRKYKVKFHFRDAFKRVSQTYEVEATSRHTASAMAYKLLANDIRYTTILEVSVWVLHKD